MTCSRCAALFEMRLPTDRRCAPCEAYVNQQIAADAKRREPRFGVAKELTGQVGPL